MYCSDDSPVDVRFSHNSVKEGIMDFMSPISQSRKTEVQGDELICPESLVKK